MKLIRYLCYGQGKYAVCDNNCKGVNPNAIIGAGVAAVGIIGISAQAIAGPAAGIGLGGLAGRYIRVLDYVIRYGYAYLIYFFSWRWNEGVRIRTMWATAMSCKFIIIKI